MRLRSLACSQKILIVPVLLCLLGSAFVKVSFGQERKIDAVFMDLDKK